MDDGYQWVNPLYTRQSEPIGGKMEAQGTKIHQAPELSLSAEIEPYAKGGWKTTIRASVRVFDGSEAMLYDKLESMLAAGLAIAQQAIEDHEANQKKEGTNDQ